MLSNYYIDVLFGFSNQIELRDMLVHRKNEERENIKRIYIVRKEKDKKDKHLNIRILIAVGKAYKNSSTQAVNQNGTRMSLESGL